MWFDHSLYSVKSSVLVLQILVAGTPQQVAEAVQVAESLREELTERAILVVPLPLYSSDGELSQPDVPTLSKDDLK